MKLNLFTKKEHTGKEKKPKKDKKNLGILPKKKKRQDEPYVLKKTLGIKILRILLWIILVFVFIRGLVDIFKPDKDEEVRSLISGFKAEFSEFSNQNAEVMSFAQNFVREYLTYEAKGAEEYKERLEPYVSNSFLNSEMNDFKKSATATYVQAYRVEKYSSAQLDVYVLAEVEYSTSILGEDGKTYTTEVSRSQLELNVPIYAAGGKYIVENIPLMVSDAVNIEQYVSEEYYGTAMNEAATKAAETSVGNFLKAYLEQEESVINYYLSAEADKTKFTGLKGRFEFVEIESLACYQEYSGADIIALVEYNIRDAENDAILLQKINLSMEESGGKYYIKSMNTRTGKLNIQ